MKVLLTKELLCGQEIKTELFDLYQFDSLYVLILLIAS